MSTPLNSFGEQAAAPRADVATQRGVWPRRASLAVERFGYLVPMAPFDGTVHSVFVRACNIACGDRLLTLVLPDLDDGPTTLRLGRNAPADLRRLFRLREPVHGRHGIAHARGVVLDVGGAAVWYPAPPGPRAPVPRIAARLRYAADALGQCRERRSSIVDREGSAVLAGLGEACRELDMARALPCIMRLAGWGEGLTPAGDDVLTGWCAALHALADDHQPRRTFLRQWVAVINGAAHRTTPIAAHYLHLAAHGHFDADVTRLRDALLCAHDLPAVTEVLTRALAAGATSGADMVTGMLHGFSAWLDCGGEYRDA